MKNVEKKYEKNYEKIFTKNNGKDIIKKKYNLFTADNEKNLQRKGLPMKKTEKIILNEVIKELNWKEKIIVMIFNKTFNKIANLVRINTVNNIIK